MLGVHPLMRLLTRRLKRGFNDSTSVLLGYTYMRFRRENAIGGNASVQFAATPQTQVRCELMCSIGRWLWSAACVSEQHTLCAQCRHDMAPLGWETVCRLSANCQAGDVHAKLMMCMHMARCWV